MTGRKFGADYRAASVRATGGMSSPAGRPDPLSVPACPRSALSTPMVGPAVPASAAGPTSGLPTSSTPESAPMHSSVPVGDDMYVGIELARDDPLMRRHALAILRARRVSAAAPRSRPLRARRLHVGGYQLPQPDTENGWRRLLHQDLPDMPPDELQLERQRIIIALAMGGDALSHLLWCTWPLDGPLTTEAWLRERQRLLIALEPPPGPMIT